MHRLRLSDLAFVIETAQKREDAERVLARLQDLSALFQEFVERALSDISVRGDDDLAEVALFALRALKHVHGLVGLVSVKLIKKDTTRSFAILCGGIARVVPQDTSSLEILYDFLRHPEQALKFFVPGEAVIDHIERIFDLLLAVGDQLHMVLRNPVKRSLKEISERGH